MMYCNIKWELWILDKFAPLVVSFGFVACDLIRTACCYFLEKAGVIVRHFHFSEISQFCPILREIMWSQFNCDSVALCRIMRLVRHVFYMTLCILKSDLWPHKSLQKHLFSISSRDCPLFYHLVCVWFQIARILVSLPLNFVSKMASAWAFMCKSQKSC